MSRQQDQVASGEIQTTAERSRGKVAQRRRGNTTKQYQEKIKRWKEAQGKGRNRRRESTRQKHKDKIKGGNNGHRERRKRGGETTRPWNIRWNLHDAKITNTATKLVKVQRRKAHIPFCQQYFLSVCNERGVHAGYPHRTWSPYTGQWTLPTSYHRLLSPHLEWCWYPLPFCRNFLSFKTTK